MLSGETLMNKFSNSNPLRIFFKLMRDTISFQLILRIINCLNESKVGERSAQDGHEAVK